MPFVSSLDSMALGFSRTMFSGKDGNNGDECYAFPPPGTHVDMEEIRVCVKEIYMDAP